MDGNTPVHYVFDPSNKKKCRTFGAGSDSCPFIWLAVFLYRAWVRVSENESVKERKRVKEKNKSIGSSLQQCCLLFLGLVGLLVPGWGETGCQFFSPLASKWQVSKQPKVLFNPAPASHSFSKPGQLSVNKNTINRCTHRQPCHFSFFCTEWSNKMAAVGWVESHSERNELDNVFTCSSHPPLSCCLCSCTCSWFTCTRKVNYTSGNNLNMEKCSLYALQVYYKSDMRLFSLVSLIWSCKRSYLISIIKFPSRNKAFKFEILVC